MKFNKKLETYINKNNIKQIADDCFIIADELKEKHLNFRFVIENEQLGSKTGRLLVHSPKRKLIIATKKYDYISAPLMDIKLELKNDELKLK